MRQNAGNQLRRQAGHVIQIQQAAVGARSDQARSHFTIDPGQLVEFVD